MKDLLPVWVQELTTAEQHLLIGLLVLVASLTLAYLFRIPLRYWREWRQIIHTVNQLGARSLRDITLPDGMGGEVKIDFLVLSSDAILVIGVKRYDGMIFGSGRTDEWTQTIHSRSYRFTNPDIYLARQISAVKNIVPKIPVKGCHLFTDYAKFPWDKPSNVLQIKDVRSSGVKRPGMKEIPVGLRTAWMEIKQAVKR